MIENDDRPVLDQLQDILAVSSPGQLVERAEHMKAEVSLLRRLLIAVGLFGLIAFFLGALAVLLCLQMSIVLPW